MTIPLIASGIAFSGIQRAEAQQSSTRLRIARFWRGEGRTLLEGVVGQPLARGTRAVTLSIKDSTGKVLHSEQWTDSAKAQAAALANAESTTPLEMVLQPGLYTVVVNSNENGVTDSISTSIRAFPGTPVLSDVVVGAHMRVLAQDEKPAAFEMQRGRYAIERGSRVTVLPAESRLWYYMELYRQGTDSIADLEFRVKPVGKDQSMVKINRTVAVGARGTVDAAALPLQGLPPGDYILSVEAKSGSRQEKRETAFTMGSFETAPPVVAETVAPAGGVSESSLYERYFAPAVSSDALITNVLEAMTVGTPGPRVNTENLTLTTDAKRRFLAKYWAAIPDPNPSTQLHEMVDEYIQRVRYVEREFAEKGRPGVKTDRGRIYLRYGPPDASQHLPIPSSQKVADIWKYTRRKALKYVFLDETGFQNYSLVYTTDPNERGRADWQDLIHDVDILRQITTF